MDDRASREKIEAGRQFAFDLLKGIKTIGMYRHNESKYGEYLSKAQESLARYSEQFGSLQLKVEITNFTLLQQDLFGEENSIPYTFFKDGIRQLTFRDGMTVEELTTFVMIALSDPERGAEDINTQLWRAQLPHLEYIMVDGFKIDTMSEEDVQIEVESIVNYLQQQLRTNSADFVRFARLSDADLDVKLENIDQLRGLIIQGVSANAELKAKIQKEIYEEENQRLFPKLISAIFQLVDSGLTEVSLLADMFSRLLDAMLLQEDFATINQVVLKLKTLEQRLGPESPIAVLRSAFIAQMSEEQRLNRVGDILKYTRLKNSTEVSRYLTTLDHSAIPALLSALQMIAIPENRLLLCDALIPIARTSPDFFVQRLHTAETPQFQRDMVYVLDRSNHPDKIKLFSGVLKTKNIVLKLEVMSIIARGRTGEAQRLISSLLDDENQQVRIQAARVLPEFDREKAYLELVRRIKTKDFENKTADEKEALYAALGSTGVVGAIDFFWSVLQQTAGMFNKQKVINEKLLAVAGLSGACTIQTAKLLQEAVDDTSQPVEVTMAARSHLARVRKQLFGAAVKEGEHG